ncbi:hypothetical protein HaLaN_27987 [Haematococcus lacustris]|uniref:Uncharacterized protein n=1 Tax=Haematococcus lacustris TaxID=44745 RepID=A0A6A0AAC9_HAELA|nr:hypothetical protein HaLaN_27987 [Haematococcus lacustris]
MSTVGGLTLRKPLLLISDIDDTWLGPDAAADAASKRLTAFWAANKWQRPAQQAAGLLAINF